MFPPASDAILLSQLPFEAATSRLPPDPPRDLPRTDDCQRPAAPVPPPAIFRSPIYGRSEYSGCSSRYLRKSVSGSKRADRQ